jgi:predicted outer membrane repeat protein
VLRVLQRTRRAAVLGVTALLAGSVGTFMMANPVLAVAGCQAGTIVVTNSSDGAIPPTGSLRAAFATASAAVVPQTICVATTVVSPITLTTAGGGELIYNALTSPGLTLQGNGVTIQAAPNAGVIDDQTTGPLRLDGITIAGGNTAAVGGGLNTVGDVTLTNSTVTNNVSAGRGGGVNANGNVTVTDSTISNNIAGFDGGGICAGGDVTVTGSTINNNQATGGGDGGGVCDFGVMTVTDSTISNNSATGGEGGGVDADGGLTLTYATVVQNTAGAGANLGFPTLASFGSVVALPEGGVANCSATGVSSGLNFSDDASCGFSTAETHPGVDPRLGPLVNNGGPTRSQLPQSNSSLLDAIPVAHCSDDGASIITPLVDQRGVLRPQGSGCDIGALEVQVAAAPVVVTPRFTG